MIRDRITSRRAAVTALGGLLAVAFAGATGARSLAAPRISVISLTSVVGGSSGYRFLVSLLIDNENTEPIAIEEIRFNIRVPGQGVLMGRAAGERTIEALERTTVQVECDGDGLPSLSQLRAAAGPGGKLDYELFGNITLVRGLKKTTPIQGRGTLTLLQPPANEPAP